MTITEIGILLITLCVMLWAIMAALHRHTAQLEALGKQIDALQASLPHPGAAPGTPPAPPPPNRYLLEELRLHAVRGR